MKTIQLVQPTHLHKSAIAEFLAAFPSSEEGIHGSAMLMFADSIESWLEEVERSRHKETVKEGWVPYEQFIALNEEQKIVGMLNFRKELNEFLLAYGGHIGYSVHPMYRKRGIGSQMLTLALKEAKKLDIHKVLITCTDHNLGSIGVIENNGGVLENKVIDPGDNELTRRYWIEI
jgi:predicted acetyltransferase